MMKTEALIADLINRTQDHLNAAEAMNLQPLEALNRKPGEDSWSALECLEHLNLYGDFYLPEIRNRMKKSKSPAKPRFRTGLLGNYFAKAMLPKEKLNKMKTFKDKNPNGSALNKQTIDRFLDQQQQTLNLLNEARKVDLTKTKTSISISKWIKLRLGDTFRVVIYHNERHLLQAQKALAASTNADVPSQSLQATP